MGIVAILRQFLRGEIIEGTFDTDEGIVATIEGKRTIRLDGDEEHCSITFPDPLFWPHIVQPDP